MTHSDWAMKGNDKKQAVPWWQCASAYKDMLSLNILLIAKQILTVSWCLCGTGWCLSTFAAATAVDGDYLLRGSAVTVWSADPRLLQATRSLTCNKGQTYWRICCSIACHWGENNHVLKTDVMLLGWKAQENLSHHRCRAFVFQDQSMLWPDGWSQPCLIYRQSSF